MNDQDLSHFITNANLNKEPQNVDVIYSFFNDMKYNINITGDRKSKRNYFIKDLINQ